MRKKEGIIIRRIGDASVLVPTGTRVIDLNCLVVLNETARRIWDLLDGRHSVEELATALVNSFEVDPEEARCDAMAFIDELGKMGMLEHAEPAC